MAKSSQLGINGGVKKKMKPTKMRNNMIYRATYKTKSKQLGSALSKELQKRYGKRSVRVVEGDSVTIVRGEFAGVDGKVAQVSTQKSSVAIEGIKKEQTRGEKYDVYVHASNLVVKSLNTDDRWRMAKLEGKNPSSVSKTATPKGDTEKEESRETMPERPKEVDERREEEEEEEKITTEVKEAQSSPPGETMSERPKEAAEGGEEEEEKITTEVKEAQSSPPKDTKAEEKSEKKEDERQW